MTPLPENVLLPAAVDAQDTLEGLLGSVTVTLLRAGWFPLEPHWRMLGRTDPICRLWLCVGGAADFVVDGVPYRLEPGGLLLIPAGASRAATHSPTNPLRVYVLQFSARLFGVLDMPTVFQMPVALRPSPDATAELVGACRRIVSDLAGGQAGATLTAGGECARVVGLLWRETVRQSASGAAAAGSGAPLTRTGLARLSRLAPVLKLIQNRYAEPLTLSSLAAVLNVNPTYFSGLFRHVTGFPPLRYLARYRLDRARELLISTNLSVGEVATLTGFGSVFHLSHAFRRAEGVSPSAFRKAEFETNLP